MTEIKFPKGEKKFNKWLIEQYFKFGSVDEVLKKHKHSLPVSYASYQRLLDKWGVVKAAGPNNKLTETLEFLTHLAEENIPFEALYKKMPPSFQTSASTLYRVLGYIKEGITRRVGTALVITPFDNPEKILFGKDISTPRLELGKPYGSLSLPMGYSRKRDRKEGAILRVLQQEVFTKKAIGSVFPNSLVSGALQPFMYLDIADVRVSVFHIQLPKECSNLINFSSYKLKSFRYLGMDDVISSQRKGNFRIGVKEAISGYNKYLNLLNRNLAVNPLQSKSLLNKQLEVVVEVSR